MSSDGFNEARTRRSVDTSEARPSSAKYLAMQWNEDRIGGDERIQREKTKRRRAVDEDPIEIVADGIDHATKSPLAFGQRDQLDLGAGQVTVRRNGLEVVYCRGQDEIGRGPRGIAGQRVVNRPGRCVLATETNAARQIALRIEVDEEDALIGDRQRGRQIDRRRRFPDPAFLIGDCDDVRHR